MIERQVIVTWYTPEEKMPPEDLIVVLSVSGKLGAVEYDHALAIGSWMDDGLGWMIEDPCLSSTADGLEVHAWADLDPYGWKD